jgi:hypothetical protein
MNRRHFFKILGFAAVGLTVVPTSPAKAEGVDPTQSYLQKEGLISQSTGYLFFAHFHTLLLPIEMLRTPPPEGADILTSLNFAHRHRVQLTEAQLIAIGNGDVVKVIDSTVSEHTFHFHLEGGLKALEGNPLLG